MNNSAKRTRRGLPGDRRDDSVPSMAKATPGKLRWGEVEEDVQARREHLARARNRASAAGTVGSVMLLFGFGNPDLQWLTMLLSLPVCGFGIYWFVDYRRMRRELTLAGEYQADEKKEKKLLRMKLLAILLAVLVAAVLVALTK